MIARQAEHFIAIALAAAPGDRALEAFCWGGARGMLALLGGDQPAAMRAFGRAAGILRECPNAEPASSAGSGWCCSPRWAMTGRRRRWNGPGGPVSPSPSPTAACSGYAEAILAGRAGDADAAADLALAGEADLAPYPVWADLARMYGAEAALADGWGEPRRWLRQPGRASPAGLDRLAQRCGRGGARPAGRRRAVDRRVTAREADVLRLVAEGLRNKEIARQADLSPRTVEKHVESLLRKTGARSRTQLVAIAGPGGPGGRAGPGAPG